jgi:hypothetical protein
VNCCDKQQAKIGCGVLVENLGDEGYSRSGLPEKGKLDNGHRERQITLEL